MAKTYKVKKGDTLGKIAQEMGVSVGDIGGYRSGNADLIYPGETLTVGGDEGNADSGSSYTDDVREGMADEYADTEETTDDPYGLEAERNNRGTYQQNREDAYENLKGLTTDVYNREYESRGLSEKKDRIATIDSEIAAARAARDEAISDVRNNPGLSASQMTGDIAKVRDYQNDIINNKIQERNSVATEYNNTLSEIDRVIENEVGDAQLDYNYWSDLLGETEDAINQYSQLYREELSDEQEQENWERALEQELTIAQMRDQNGGGGSGAWQLVYDDYGDPLYWFNNDTKEIEYVEDSGSGGGQGGVNFDSLEEDVESDGGGGNWFGNVWRAITGG